MTIEDFYLPLCCMKHGKMLYQDYLREDGVWKLREYASDGHVEVNAKASVYLISFDGEEETHTFLNKRYDAMRNVIEEVVEAYVKRVDPKDMFCIAMDGQHLQVLDEALQGRKRYCLSMRTGLTGQNCPSGSQ